MKLFSSKKKGGKKGESFCTVVIAAAGSSSRMGEDKLFMMLGGMPVIAHTLLAFDRVDCINRIIVVTQVEKIVLIQDVCKEFGIEKPVQIIAGGERRSDSVRIGVGAAQEAEFIAIHDGARPLVSKMLIERTFEHAIKYGAAAPGVPVKDTIKVIGKGGVVEKTPDRATLVAVQTPQIFDAGLIKGALHNAMEKGIEITDDCSAVEAIGMSVHITEGDYRNIKITTEEDFLLAEALLSERAYV